MTKFEGLLAGYENNIRGCVKNTKYPPNAEILFYDMASASHRGDRKYPPDAEIWQTLWQPLHSICVNYCQIIVKDNNLHMCCRQKPLPQKLLPPTEVTAAAFKKCKLLSNFWKSLQICKRLPLPSKCLNLSAINQVKETFLHFYLLAYWQDMRTISEVV